MRRSWLVAALVAAPVLLTSVIVPALASRKTASQVVTGRILVPDLEGVPTQQCRAWNYTRVKGSIDGAILHEFEVDPNTFQQGFSLDVVEGGDDVNLEIFFDTETWIGYSTIGPGGEAGVVPPEATRAVICLSAGAGATFRYEAGPTVRPPSVEAEARAAEHSDNLRLLARAATTDAPRRLVFQGDRVFSSSRTGMNVFRLLPDRPFIKQISHLYCPGSVISADVSVWGDYVFQSVPQEYPYLSISRKEYNGYESKRCNNTDDSVTAGGVRVLDVSDPRRPHQVKFFKTPCGSMNHTLIPHRGQLYIYLPTPCEEDFPANDPWDIRPLNYQIQVLRFDRSDPDRSRRVGTPPLVGQLGCHDITVFPSRDLAACPQFFNQVGRTALLDISDPLNPEVLSHLELPVESTWAAHAAFTWDGRHLVVSDTEGAEYVGEERVRCTGENGDKLGALWIYDVRDPRAPRLVSSYTLPRAVDVTTALPCSPWEVNMIPTRDRRQHVAVVGWNTGGLTLVDLSDADRPRELAHWQPPRVSSTLGAYFYNGRVYSTEYWNGAGIRVFELDGFARDTTWSYARRMNPQTQLIEFRR